jgi:hypothetical protein
MQPDLASYPGYRFPAEIISHAVWLYHVFSLSLRDVELILAERGIAVTHESIRQWGLRFGADFARSCAGASADRTLRLGHSNHCPLTCQCLRLLHHHRGTTCCQRRLSS